MGAGPVPAVSGAPGRTRTHRAGSRGARPAGVLGVRRPSRHFAWHELSSPRVGRRGRDPVPRRYRKNVVKLCEALEVGRAAAGGKPWTILSGWRSPTYNRANKGRATLSQHLYGRAADIKVKGMTPAQVYWLLWDLIQAGEIPKGGLACYRTFVHYDTRGWNARWLKAPPRPRRLAA